MISKIATFIADQNNCENQYVGYCGTEPQEIEASIRNFDLPVDQSFCILERDGKVIGALGFDVDVVRNEAEVWGPFVLGDDWASGAASLWQMAKLAILPKINKLNFFYGNKNLAAINFALDLGAIERSESSILVLEKSNAKRFPGSKLAELSPSHVEAFITLHDRLFPSAYLSGQEIFDGLDRHHKVFIIDEKEKLVGYIYVEAVPEHGEGTLHFFGVNSESRGKGYGQQLLACGIEFIFGFGETREISLCVDVQSENAIRLYSKMGFLEHHRCLHLTLDL